MVSDLVALRNSEKHTGRMQAQSQFLKKTPFPCKNI